MDRFIRPSTSFLVSFAQANIAFHDAANAAIESYKSKSSYDTWRKGHPHPAWSFLSTHIPAPPPNKIEETSIFFFLSATAPYTYPTHQKRQKKLSLSLCPARLFPQRRNPLPSYIVLSQRLMLAPCPPLVFFRLIDLPHGRWAMSKVGRRAGGFREDGECPQGDTRVRPAGRRGQAPAVKLGRQPRKDVRQTQTQTAVLRLLSSDCCP